MMLKNLCDSCTNFGDYMFRTYRDCIPGERMWTTSEVVNQGLDILTTIKDGKWKRRD